MDLDQVVLQFGEIRTYFKLLKIRCTSPSRRIGWTEFATTNVPDADSSKFRSYEYDADNLEEFSGFAIKIVMKSKDTTQPCGIKAFRSLALAKIKGKEHLVKDDFSKAVINTDKDHILCIKNEDRIIQAKNGEIEQLKIEMSELKMMMTQVLEKCNGKEC